MFGSRHFGKRNDARAAGGGRGGGWADKKMPYFIIFFVRDDYY